jgi:hypothetical protein
LIPALQSIQEKILREQQLRRQTLVVFFQQIGLFDVAEKIQEYGLPKSILVPKKRMTELRYLALIAPVTTRPGWEPGYDKVIFSWVDQFMTSNDKQVPLMKRVHLIEAAHFPDANIPGQ